MENEGWQFIKKEIEDQIMWKAREIDTLQSKGIINESQYHGGVKRGLEMALNLPENIFKKEKSFIEKMKESIFGRSEHES